jgi:quercetin dioxygenase-like cupin family protein
MMTTLAVGLAVAAGLVLAPGAQAETWQTTMAPYTAVENVKHATDRTVEVVEGSTFYSDAQGTRRLIKGDKVFIPAGRLHSNVTYSGVTFRHTGGGVKHDSCGAGI